MKCVLFIIILIFTVTVSAYAGIAGTKHDGSRFTPGGQICIVCHTPHNASAATSVPLWNHTTTQATYTVYSSPTLNAAVGQPSSSSKACLSCHDGTVALDSYGNSGTSNYYMRSGPKLGTDLSNDHPVSFTYDTNLTTQDSGLYDPAVKTVSSLGGKTISESMLKSGKVECSSCHDVHGNKGDSATAGKLLLVNNNGSALCLTCHNK